MSREADILIWTFVLTVVLLIWNQVKPPYSKNQLPKELESIINIDESSIDIKALENLSR